MSERRIDPTLIALVLGLMLSPAHADLVGHWMFDEGGGTIATDKSGHGNHGTLVGGPAWIAGNIGSGALIFDNVDDVVEIPGDSVFDLDETITIAAWIFWRRRGDFDTIVVKGPTGTAPNSFPGNFEFITARNGALLFGHQTAEGNQTEYYVSDRTVLPGRWTHVAVTLVELGFVDFYIDGQGAGLSEQSGEFGIFNDEPVRIGGGLDGTFLFDGAIDDVQIYNHALTIEEIQEAMAGLPSELAAIGGPANWAIHVDRDALLEWTPGVFAKTHTVYFSTIFDDVNEATLDDPRGALVGQALTDTTFDPGRLEFDQTYYWRVDEVSAAPDFTAFKGDVWRFTAEHLAIRISSLTATASSSFGVSGPEKTIDGSGLVDDLHGVSGFDMWISEAIPATIEYTFDRAYRLHELWIWNSNQPIEASLGFGAKEVVIEHSVDGENWTVLEGIEPLAQASGEEGYAHNNSVDFGGAIARHVRVTVNSVQGTAPQASLSEVLFFFIPTFATGPDPASGVTGVAPDVTLAWSRDGREAGSHDVYLGIDANDLSLAGRVNESGFDTLAMNLELDQTYYWRVDEVNDAMEPGVWTGDVWSFTTVDALVIDDMERYRDEDSFQIWATWVDGFEDPANGSLVGTGLSGSEPETEIVSEGDQSLPLNFDNTTAPRSEATRTFDDAQDWTRYGIQSLVLRFLRGADNTGAGQVYVKINDTKLVHPQDPAALPPGWDVWTPWTIDLSTVPDATSVRSLTIGVEGAGGLGVIYWDSIELFRDAPPFFLPVSWFEAESGAITAPLQVFTDDFTASAGEYIGTKSGIGNEYDTPPADGVATYSFDVPEDGEYRLVFRVIIPPEQDSFWVRIPGAETDTTNHASGWVRMNPIVPGDTWHWDGVFSWEPDDSFPFVTFTLSAGTHTLEIARREDAALLDAIAIMLRK